MKVLSIFSKKKLISKILTTIGFFAIFGLLYRIGWTQIALRLTQIGWKGSLILVILGFLEACFDALSLQKAILDRIGFWRVLSFNQAGFLLNLFAPGEAGEIFKASILEKEAPKRGAAGTVAWNVIYKLSKSFVILLSALIAWIFLQSLRKKTNVILATSLIGFILYFVLMAIIRKGYIGRFTLLLKHIPGLKIERVEAWNKHACHIENQVLSFQKNHPRYYWSVLANQIMARIMGFLSLWIILSLIQTRFTFVQATLIFASSELVGYLLPLLLTRVGTTEGSSYLLFSFLGFDGGIGVIFQIIIRIKQILVLLICLSLGTLLHVPLTSEILSRKDLVPFKSPDK